MDLFSREKISCPLASGCDCDFPHCRKVFIELSGKSCTDSSGACELRNVPGLIGAIDSLRYGKIRNAEGGKPATKQEENEEMKITKTYIITFQRTKKQKTA